MVTQELPGLAAVKNRRRAAGYPLETPPVAIAEFPGAWGILLCSDINCLCCSCASKRPMCTRVRANQLWSLPTHGGNNALNGRDHVSQPVHDQPQLKRLI